MPIQFDVLQKFLENLQQRQMPNPNDIFGGLPANPKLPQPTPPMRPAPDQVPASPLEGAVAASPLSSYLKSPDAMKLFMSLLQPQQSEPRRVQLPIPPSPQLPQFRGPNPGLFGG